MDRKVRASIYMGVYNGAKYLPEQLDSIIKMMKKEDELIISYDQSSDDTWGIINDYAERFPNILVVSNPGEAGVTPNFLNAISYARGKYLVSSDQDDVWINNKLEKMISAMEENGASIALHDTYMCDALLNILPGTLFDLRGRNLGVFKNFLKNTYMGCCIVYRSEYAPLIAHTKFIPDSADQWAGIVCAMYGKAVLVDEPLHMHRLHENNVTPKEKRSFITILMGRIKLLWNIIEVRKYAKKINWKPPVMGGRQ